jgi:hypothetical protein
MVQPDMLNKNDSMTSADTLASCPKNVSRNRTATLYRNTTAKVQRFQAGTLATYSLQLLINDP